MAALAQLQQHSKELLPRRIEVRKQRRPFYEEQQKDMTLLNPNHNKKQQLQHQQGGTENGEAEAIVTVEKPRFYPNGQPIDEDDPLYNEPDIVLNKNYQAQMTWGAKQQQGASVGLVNCGNTCYLNTVLQCIAYCCPLATCLMTSKPPASAQSGSAGMDNFNALAALGKTIRMLHGREGQQQGKRGSSFRPNDILNGLRRMSRSLRPGEQHDAQEFATALLDACQNSQLRQYLGSKKVTLQSQQTTPLQQVMGGYLRSSVIWSRKEEYMELRAQRHAAAPELTQMKANDLYSNTYDPCSMISLPLMGTTVEDCFTAFCKPEKLPGKIYRTPRGVSVNAVKQFSLHIPPKTMVLHLKRFDNHRKKLGKRIQFREKLDVSSHISDKRLETCTYKLMAVSCHLGSTLAFGHYIAYVLGSNRTWYECDDSRVTQVGVNTVLKQEAYMLWYVLDSIVEKKAAPAEKAPEAKLFATTSMSDLTSNGIDVGGDGEEINDEQASAIVSAKQKRSEEFRKKQEEETKKLKEAAGGAEPIESGRGGFPTPIRSVGVSPRISSKSPALLSLKKPLSCSPRLAATSPKQIAQDGVVPTMTLPAPGSLSPKLTGKRAQPNEEDSEDSDDVMDSEAEEEPASKRQRLETEKAEEAAQPKPAKEALRGQAAKLVMVRLAKHHTSDGALKQDASDGKFNQPRKDEEWDNIMDKPREKKRKRDRDLDDEEEGPIEPTHTFQEIANMRARGEELPERKSGAQQKQERLAGRGGRGGRGGGDDGPRTCFRCGKMGHMSAHCPTNGGGRGGGHGGTIHRGGSGFGGRGGGHRGGRGGDRGGGSRGRGGDRGRGGSFGGGHSSRGRGSRGQSRY